MVIKLTVINISPRVMRFNDEVAVVEYCKTVDNMGADIWVNVVGFIFANARAIPGPVCEIAHNHVVT